MGAIREFTRLTPDALDALERAVRERRRVALRRRGTEYVVVAERLETGERDEALEGRLPMTGELLEFPLRELESFAVLPQPCLLNCWWDWTAARAPTRRSSRPWCWPSGSAARWWWRTCGSGEDPSRSGRRCSTAPVSDWSRRACGPSWSSAAANPTPSSPSSRRRSTRCSWADAASAPRAMPSAPPRLP